MISENDVIKANNDINKFIKKNTIGTVLQVYENGKFFLVEFFDNIGNTIGDGMETVSKKDVILFQKYS